MADRIRVFQDVQPSWTRISSLRLPLRISTDGPGPALTSNTGQDTSHDSPPVERVPGTQEKKDCREEHPTVAMTHYHDARDLEKRHGEQYPSLPFRPFTSMDWSRDEQTPFNQDTRRHTSLRFRRQNPSTEDTSNDPALEFTMARSRLRTVPDKQQALQDKPTPLHSDTVTMDDLNTMLDDAIKDTSPKSEILLDEQPANLAPKHGFVLSRTGSRHDRRRSQSRGRLSRKVTESIEPRTSEESTRVHYDQEEVYKHTPHKNEAPHKNASRSSTFARQETQKSSDITSPAAPQAKENPESKTELSPVKQRAALFESLTKMAKPAGHDSVCRHFGHGQDANHGNIHHCIGTPPKPPLKVHRIKFGDRIEERPATPLIPLTLPTLVSSEKTTRPTSALDDGQNGSQNPSSDDVFKDEAHERKPSLSWPFKWGLFNKGASAPPQEMGFAISEAQARDEHCPQTRPSIVRTKVRKILQAVEEKDDTGQRRRDADRQCVGHRNTRPQPPSRRQTVTKCVDVEQDVPVEVMPVERPSSEKEATPGIKPVPTSTDKPKTPLQRAMSEKQVFAPPTNAGRESDSTSSPRKSLPHTPVRGRPRVATEQLPEASHAVERRFNLSPARSTSRQRPGVKVEVEIRDSPDREAQKRGDKIVIVRANVASDLDGDKAL